MTTAQEVETSVTKNSLSKEYPHPDDQTTDNPVLNNLPLISLSQKISLSVFKKANWNIAKKRDNDKLWPSPARVSLNVGSVLYYTYPRLLVERSYSCAGDLLIWFIDMSSTREPEVHNVFSWDRLWSSVPWKAVVTSYWFLAIRGALGNFDSKTSRIWK